MTSTNPSDITMNSVNPSGFYVIISHEHTNGDNFAFWGKNRSGYVTDITKAGLYSFEEASKISDNNVSHDETHMLFVDALNYCETTMRATSKKGLMRVLEKKPKSTETCHDIY